jgi:YegS/Rv2252/BmrU family lipid kinase
MKATLIINPFSGKRRAPLVVDRARLMAGELEVSLSVERIKGPGHGAELARAAVRGGAERVLCAGGDGTLNAVAVGLLGSRVPLGVVPMGSGNGYARSLGLPREPREALKVALTGMIQPMDVGYLNERPFLGVAGLGFDARIADLFSRGANRGFVGYLLAVLKEIAGAKPMRVRMLVDGRAKEANLLMLVFCNTREFGSGACISPASRPDDGVAELKLVRKPGWASLPMACIDLYIGRADRSPHIATLPAIEARVHQEGTMAHLDGEPVRIGHEVRFGLERGLLGVVVAGSAPKAPGLSWGDRRDPG